MYEYIRLRVDRDDLSQLNRFGRDGWRVVAVLGRTENYTTWVLLERKDHIESGGSR